MWPFNVPFLIAKLMRCGTWTVLNKEMMNGPGNPGIINSVNGLQWPKWWAELANHGQCHPAKVVIDPEAAGFIMDQHLTDELDQPTSPLLMPLAVPILDGSPSKSLILLQPPNCESFRDHPIVPESLTSDHLHEEGQMKDCITHDHLTLWMPTPVPSWTVS